MFKQHVCSDAGPAEQQHPSAEETNRAKNLFEDFSLHVLARLRCNDSASPRNPLDLPSTQINCLQLRLIHNDPQAWPSALGAQSYELQRGLETRTNSNPVASCPVTLIDKGTPS